MFSTGWENQALDKCQSKNPSVRSEGVCQVSEQRLQI